MQAPGLRAARRRALLTQAELATAARVSRVTVARLEAGEVGRFATIKRLATALRVEPAELVGTTGGDGEREDKV